MEIQKTKLYFKEILAKGKPFFFRKKQRIKRKKYKINNTNFAQKYSILREIQKENTPNKPTPPAPKKQIYMFKPSYIRRSIESQTRINKKPASSLNHSWGLAPKIQRHKSANPASNGRARTNKSRVNSSLNQAPKRLSKRAKGLFINSFLRSKQKRDRPKSLNLSLKQRKPRLMSAVVSLSKKSTIDKPTINSQKPKVKDPFTPKFSVLKKVKKIVNIDMNSFCSKFLTPFVHEIDSLHAQFKNIREIGRGSYAVAYLATERQKSGEVVVKQLKLSMLTKASRIKRFLVDEVHLNGRRKWSCCASSGRSCSLGYTRYFSTSSTCIWPWTARASTT